MKKLIVKIKSRSELEKYYIDEFDDVWENRKTYLTWKNNERVSEDVINCVYSDELTNRTIDFYVNYVDISKMMWAIDEIYPKETHPEYYL